MKQQGNIFLIGFMGAGKSTIAAGLGEMLEMERVEMDQMIVRQQGMEISEIFDRFGEPYFRDLETKVLSDLGQEGPFVVSCGGGAGLLFLPFVV